MIQLGNRYERITTFSCIDFSIGACLTVQCDAVNAVIKRRRIDAGYAGRQVNFRQISAPAESVAADCGHAVGKGDVCKLATGGKHIGGNNGRTIGKTTLVRERQFVKQYSPMLLTLPGIVISGRLLQKLKA